MTLLTHQSSAISKLNNWKVGALFMKMGSGKTRVAVELVNSVPNVDLVVWVGPLRTIMPIDEGIASVKDEVAKWGGFHCDNVVYIGVETIQSSDRQYLHLYRMISEAWKPFIIVDESIKIKNFDAKRTQRLMELGKMVEYKLILNGEPITRDLLDIWSQIQFLSPKILNMDLAEFKNTFCKYTRITKTTHGYGRTYTKEYITGYENIDYLYSLIGEYVFECDLDLNVQRYFTEANYRIDDDAKEKYYKLKEKYLDDEMLLMRNNNIFLELTMKMQHGYCCTEDKFRCVDEWLSEYPEEKTIIFCKYIASTEECKRRYPKATVLNYKSGSFGLNLQHLPYMVMFDKTFDWGDDRQALARNYRTGSMEDVRVLQLTGDVGLETLIKKNNDKKLSIAEYLKTVSRDALKEAL